MRLVGANGVFIVISDNLNTANLLKKKKKRYYQLYTIIPMTAGVPSAKHDCKEPTVFS